MKALLTWRYRPRIVFGSFCISLITLLPQLSLSVPRIGYLYPAGGRAGTDFEILIGGQYLDDPVGGVVSGEGVTVEVIEHIKMPSAQVVDDFRDRLNEVRPEIRELNGDIKTPADDLRRGVIELLDAAGVSEKQLSLLYEYDRRRNDPKQQLNTQIGENVRMRITVDERAIPGMRFLRLITANGLSNPMRFVIGQQPEITEPEPWKFDLLQFVGLTPSDDTVRPRRSKSDPVALPVTLNGRILPGEEDEFSFQAKAGDQVVVSLQARNLIPYLADAVPGWFQAVVSLRDPRGKELAYADDYRFDPDPVLFYRIPNDGEYRLRVRDSIYRGREDFVYRVTMGELPFLTGISPLGGRAGSEVDLTFHGGNLEDQVKRRFPIPEATGFVSLFTSGKSGPSNSIAFHVDTVPEESEREDNGRLGVAGEIKLPGIVNGSIGRPGDVDFFRVKGAGNKPMVFEIFARRLGSPVDSSLTVFDDDGKQIAFNDDFENPTSGLTTHHADSRISVILPKNGQCFVRVSDTQNRSGFTNTYRLKINQAVPTFALRVTPASLNAKPGTSARLTVHALRLDGFDGAIGLRLKEAPDGFDLKSATIPAGEDHADFSLAVPAYTTNEPVSLKVEGFAVIDEKEVIVEAVPADDMMQAFIYRHLVPVDELLLDVRTPPEKLTP